MATDLTSSKSRHSRISRIYPYIRHTIPTVRLAVAKALRTFATVEIDRMDWMYDKFFSLLYQNLVLEERPDVRAVTFDAFIAAVNEVEQNGGLDGTVGCNLEDWYEIAMTPIGLPLDNNLFVRVGKGSSGYNVDKPMLAGDVSLVPIEKMLETRISAAKALAFLRKFNTENEVSDVGLLRKAISSRSAHKIWLASVIIEEWAKRADSETEGQLQALGKTDEVGQQLADVLVKFVEAGPPGTYDEQTMILRRIMSECQALFNAFAVEGKVSKAKIPTLPTKVDPLDSSDKVFTIHTAQMVVGPHFDALAKSLGKNAVKMLPSLQDRQRRVMISMGYLASMRDRLDVQVFSAVCGALIGLRVMPAKFGPVVKSVMDGVEVGARQAILLVLTAETRERGAAVPRGGQCRCVCRSLQFASLDRQEQSVWKGHQEHPRLPVPGHAGDAGVWRAAERDRRDHLAQRGEVGRDAEEGSRRGEGRRRRDGAAVDDAPQPTRSFSYVQGSRNEVWRVALRPSPAVLARHQLGTAGDVPGR